VTDEDDAVHNAAVEQEIREFAVEDLQDGALSAQTIKSHYHMEHRKDAVVHGKDEDLLTTEEVQTVLNEMVDDGLLVQLEEPEGWYQLADWEERPLRLFGVSHHVVRMAGISQLEEVWLDESIRAARYEHTIHDRELQPMKSEDQRQIYNISCYHYDGMMQYRDTLLRLSREVEDSNPQKATLYSNLAEAINIDGPADSREEEVVLRP